MGNPDILAAQTVKLPRTETLLTALTARSIAPSNLLLGSWLRLLQRDLEARLPPPD